MLQKIILIHFLVLAFCSSAFLQTTDTLFLKAKHLVMRGSITGDTTMIHKGREQFERLLNIHAHKELVRYYLAYCDYSMVNAGRRWMNSERRGELLNRAIQHLEEVVKLESKFADAFGLLSACYGQKSGEGMWAGMRYGLKSSSEIDKALKLEPNNPRILILHGIKKYYTPGLFGGDKDEALKLFTQAAKLFQVDSSRTNLLQPDWGHAEAYAWIGVAYIEKKDTLAARAAFEKALTIEPDFGWVKYVLYPRTTSNRK